MSDLTNPYFVTEGFVFEFDFLNRKTRLRHASLCFQHNFTFNYSFPFIPIQFCSTENIILVKTARSLNFGIIYIIYS